MSIKLMKWIACALIVIILVSWSFILHPSQNDAGHSPPHPGSKPVLIPQQQVVKQSSTKKQQAEKSTFLDRDQVLQEVENPLMLNKNNANVDKLANLPVRYQESIPENGVLQKPNIQIGVASREDLNRQLDNNKIEFMPKKNQQVKQNKKIQRAINSKQNVLKNKVLPLSPAVKQKAVILNRQKSIDSDQLQGSNARYKQVILDQAEKILNANLNEKETAKDDEFIGIEQDMIRRRERVKQTCYDYGLGTRSTQGRKKQLRYPPSANYDVLYIARSQALTWCPVYKAASTTWLNFLSLLAGAKQSMLDSTKDQISTIARRLYPTLEYDEAQQAVIHTTKFMIVRDPFERLVSAYRDKLENLNIGQEHGVQHFYEKYGKKIVKKYRTKQINDANLRQMYLIDENSDQLLPRGVEPTFAEFVKYIIDTDLVHYADDHWMPYYLYCTPCYLDYDVIATFETLEMDQAYLLHKLKLDDAMQPKWKHLTKGKQTVDVAKKYFSSITRNDVRKLANKYKVDFEMYGYSMEKYLSYAKSISEA